MCDSPITRIIGSVPDLRTNILPIFDIFFPQILNNIKVKNQNVINNKNIKKAILESGKNISKIGRILVRKSGTEPIIRVMGESHNYQSLKKNINIITTAIKKYS